MRKYIKHSIVVLIVSLLYLTFFSSVFKKKVAILEKFDFNKGSWILVRGSDDSIRYVMDDKSTLNKLKDQWILYKSNENFATTGGYNIELFNDSDRVMLMDIINDGWISRITSGILSNSEYGTLYYNNLSWIDVYPEKWVEAKQIVKQFFNNESKCKYLDSLRIDHKVYVLYKGDLNNGNYMRCLVTKKK